MSDLELSSGRDPCLFSLDELSEIEQFGQMAVFQPGDIIYREGEEGSSLFFIKEGSIQAFKLTRDFFDEILSIRSAGELLGEIYPGVESVRFATAQALEQVAAIRLEQSDFLRLSREKPPIVLKVLGYLSSKMKDSDNFRVRLLEKKNEQILRSYEELKNAQEELMKRERLAAVGGLASKIIHDIKGTITPLKVYSENLDHLPEEARNFGIQTIRLSIGRILRICEELLEYVRGTPISLQLNRRSIRDFIDHELAFLSSFMNHIEVKTDFAYDGDIVIDDERMGRVLQNLLLNAKEAMPDGGMITIRTALADGCVEINVSDTGCGILGEMKEKIFEPFVSVGKKKGTGLGLTISKKIMEEHGGNIEVESEPGKGCSFILKIPVRQSP